MDVINRYNKRLANRQNAEIRRAAKLPGVYKNTSDIPQVEPDVKEYENYPLSGIVKNPFPVSPFRQFMNDIGESLSKNPMTCIFVIDSARKALTSMYSNTNTKVKYITNKEKIDQTHILEN